MPRQHETHTSLHIFEHPLIQQKLTKLRDRDASTETFRRLLNQIAGLMVFQVCRDFATKHKDIDTPMEPMQGTQLAQPVTVVPILRAGIGMTDGILALMPEARVGHLGLYRDEDTLKPVSYYAKFPPDMDAGPVLLVDPMLATGGSATAAIRELKAHGCTDIRFVCLVAAPEGVERLEADHPDIPIFAAALDRKLNDAGYILPGLGDAGDRIFGTL
jgi:uracil phosphoribosyltransferase